MKDCVQCQTKFEITDRDRKFYASIGVPEPTRCPLCRRVRLLAWRNQRTLYSRKCQAPGHSENIVSIFAPDAPYTVYDRDFWWSDAWNPLDYRSEIDFSRPFGEQYDALLHRVPLLGIVNGKSENSAYTNHCGEMKSSYLTFASWDCEKVLYSDLMIKNKECIDCLETHGSEQCYECIGCIDSYGLRFCQASVGCRDSWFLFDCRNCADCVGCVNLRNKQYHIWNKPYAKEEYQKEVARLGLSTISGNARTLSEFIKLKLQAPHRYAILTNSDRVTGDNITNSHHALWSFNADKAEDCAYIINVAPPVKDTYDGYGVGATLTKGYMLFDTGAQGADNYFCGTVWGSQSAYYAYNCYNCTEIFGCYGLRGQKYCILNKQYPKDEYEKIKTRLIEHMKTTGEWGEFFDPQVSPFGYNETLSAEYRPLTKEQALAQGFKWQDQVSGIWGKETMGWDKIGETINEVPATITKELLACQDCKRNYQIVAQELSFYQKMDMPVPRRCPECRYQARLKARNPHWLWRRQCVCDITAHAQHPRGRCPNEFETPYAPERSERVFCEQCYQFEVV